MADAGEQEENAFQESESKKKHKKKHKKRKVDVKMEIVTENLEKVAPLVGYFPSGFDPQKTKDEIGVMVFRNKTKQNRMQLVVSPNGSKVDFVGSNHSGEAATTQVCTYALGVLDKEAHTLKIVPIASNKIFRLEPRVPGVDHLDEDIQELKEDAAAAQEKANQINNLTLTYGTKGARNQVKKQATLKQKEEPSAQENLKNKLEDISINKEAIGSVEVSTARNIPPHDTTATIPEKAYPLEKIIYEGEFRYVLDFLERVESETKIEASVYPSFVCNRAHKLLEIQNELQKKKLACVLSYIAQLVKHKPSVEKTNLLVSYVLVLTLFADGFRTDPSDIARDLRMRTLSIREHYKNLGCKIEWQDKVIHFIAIYAPLWGAILFNGFTYFQVIRMLNNARRMAAGMADHPRQFDARADMKGLFNSIAYGLNSSVRRAIYERLEFWRPDKLRRCLPSCLKLRGQEEESELVSLKIQDQR
ncbi:hypothetical protein Syun_027280 [Stephania yunnanensis]|uniref:DNA-directed RNA polymerase I subunit rpa49 n=1 Tax=Stephania yunnanensis TaxID=152371 RepID=A0AAP0HMN4_9MAGN